MIYFNRRTAPDKVAAVAKVILILEDTFDADGNAGLIIDHQCAEDFQDGSLAHEYSAMFLQAVMDSAEKTEILDRNAAEILPKKADPDSTLN